ncbi:MAG: rhomboid family intramembrane serine protease, partial [Candidatus Omnitrophica bacterium]|nr:rhomboid family intramembrane serine protease [Candidatus Omnitrophota bacterium]
NIYRYMSDNERSFARFLFGSMSVNLIVLANILVFIYLPESFLTEVVIRKYVLYPGNLLKGNFTCLITSGFIHRNGMHLMMNMLGVFIFGRVVERRLGFFKTIFIYLGALLISMLFSTFVYMFVLKKSVAIIGASGAVMGLMAAAMLLNPFYISYEMILPLPVMVKGWFFLYADIKGLMNGESDGISHLAHLFGFMSMGLLVYFLSRQDKKILRAGLMINIISFIAFLIIRVWILSKI